jgi:hypothetical protein
VAQTASSSPSAACIRRSVSLKVPRADDIVEEPSETFNAHDASAAVGASERGADAGFELASAASASALASAPLAARRGSPDRQRRVRVDLDVPWPTPLRWHRLARSSGASSVLRIRQRIARNTCASHTRGRALVQRLVLRLPARRVRRRADRPARQGLRPRRRRLPRRVPWTRGGRGGKRARPERYSPLSSAQGPSVRLLRVVGPRASRLQLPGFGEPGASRTSSSA